MIQRNLIPKFMYPVLHTDLDRGGRREMDLALRRGVRPLLHLPNDTPLGFFYASVKAGGLGLCCFETRMTAIRDEMLKRLATSSPDPVVLELARGILEEEGKADLLLGGAGAEGAANAIINPSLTEKRQWSNRLWEARDGRGLKDGHKYPSMREWITDGTTLLR